MTRINRKPPGVTAKARKKKKRADDAVAKRVRAEVAKRDGFCRFGNWEDNPDDWHAEALEGDGCEGDPQWAHLGDKRRFKTRGMAPETRHTTAGSLMLCKKHHTEYDKRRLLIEVTDPFHGADGVLEFRPEQRRAEVA